MAHTHTKKGFKTVDIESRVSAFHPFYSLIVCEQLLSESLKSVCASGIKRQSRFPVNQLFDTKLTKLKLKWRMCTDVK